MPPPLVLDTNALLSRGFHAWLRQHHGRKILPVAAFVELGLHMRRRWSQDQYQAYLDRLGIEVEWLRQKEARWAIEVVLAGGRWDEHAQDYLIGAHALPPPRLLVTNNVKDFAFLGDRVRTPGQLMSSPPR